MSVRERLRERLGDLARARRTGEPAASASGDAASVAGDRAVPAPPTRRERRRARLEREHAGAAERATVEEFLPGGEWRSERGAVYVHERLRSGIERPRAHWGRLDEPPAEEGELSELATCGLASALFLDLETGGLASSPVFLAGTMHWNGEDFVLRQYFARHYGEEAALIDALREAARGFRWLVTFNGRSYDAPFLLGRAAVHGVPLALPPRHLDLLHVSRRRWRDELADCRLQTLELHVTRRRRFGDVPGDEVPGLYHDFVRGGDPYRMVPVFHHNLLDVITMGEILHALCRPWEGAAAGRSRGGRRASARASARVDRPLTWP